jgi:hypothetical protein
MSPACALGVGGDITNGVDDVLAAAGQTTCS